MKKSLIIILQLFLILPLYAEDVIQIVPIKTTAGITSTTAKGLEVSLSNSTFAVANLQFDILLPEGMTLTGNSSFTTRVPRTAEEDENEEGETIITYKYDFSYQTAVQTTGYTRFMFIPGGELRPIPVGEGVIMKLRYKTDATMSPGIYPIYMSNIKLVKSVTESITIPSVVSYVIIGDNTSASFDLSTLTGYVPSFVVEKLNEDMAADENLSIVDLSGATELGAELQTPEDVVSVVGTTGTLNREFTAKYWSSVCLPFAVSAEQVAALNAGGVEIERFAGYDASTGSLQFESVDAMEANTPYIVCSPTAQSPFTGLEGVTLSKGDMNHTVVGDMTFMGTFERQTISSDETATYYAFSATDGKFVRIGSNAKVAPFRAYLKLAANSSSRLLNVVHNGGDATAIEQPQAAAPTGDCRRYTLQGIQQTTSSPAKGIVIENGLKRIVR